MALMSIACHSRGVPCSQTLCLGTGNSLCTVPGTARNREQPIMAGRYVLPSIGHSAQHYVRIGDNKGPKLRAIGKLVEIPTWDNQYQTAR